MIRNLIPIGLIFGMIACPGCIGPCPRQDEGNLSSLSSTQSTDPTRPGGGDPPPPPEDETVDLSPRCIVVMVVRTPHNPWRQESNRKIADLIVPYLGPGDVLRIIHVTGAFAEQVNVWAFLAWPALPGDLRRDLVDENSHLRRPENVFVQDDWQARLEEAWAVADEQLADISTFLQEERIDPHLHEGEGIDLERPLHFALERLNEAPGGRWLIIFGPLRHQPLGAAEPSALQPPTGLKVDGLCVLNLFVPFQSKADFDNYGNRWTEYFTQMGAKSFTAMNRSDSWNRSEILPSSGVPQEVPLPDMMVE